MGCERIKVSIIIPVYNASKTIERAINTCRNQTYLNLEIICVDDGSYDDSLYIMNEQSQKDKRVVVISKKNGGVVSARREGIKKSSGNFLFFLDADDCIVSDAIEILVRDAITYEADLVRGNMGKYDEAGHLLECDMKLIHDSGLTMSGLEFIPYYLKSFPSLCGTLIGVDLFENLYYVEDNIKVGEDLLTVFELAKRSKKVYIEGAILYQYIENKNSVMNSVHTIENTKVYSENNCKLILALFGKYQTVKGCSNQIDIVVQELIIDLIISKILNHNVKIKYRKKIGEIYRKCFLLNIRMHKYFFRRLHKEYIYMLLTFYRYI